MSRSAKDHDARRRANAKRRTQDTSYWQRIRGGRYKRVKSSRPPVSAIDRTRAGCAPGADALEAWWELGWLEQRFGARTKSRLFRAAMRSAQREYLAWLGRERAARSKGGRPRKQQVRLRPLKVQGAA